MGPPASRRISRVLRYSGTGSRSSSYAYVAVTLFGWAFLPYSALITSAECRPSTPAVRRPPVWPLPSSLATTKGIEFSFFSSGYLDVSLPRVPSCETMDSSHGDRALPRPGSPIRKSVDQCLLAAPHSLSQLIASFVGNQCPGIHPALLFA